MASINNRTMNATSLTQISEDLWYLVQSDMDKRAFQIQRMLADELDWYKGKDNKYVEDNIKEIQELYMNKEINQAQGTIENEEVILVRLYQVESTTTSLSSSSFISDEIANLKKYMKFVKTPSQTRIFWPPPYYLSLISRGEQDPSFWKEVATAFLDKKKNTDTARNGCQIPMYQRGPPHEPYFITIDNRDQIIIGSSKKIIATHVVGELEVLIWFMWTWILNCLSCNLSSSLRSLQFKAIKKELKLRNQLKIELLKDFKGNSTEVSNWNRRMTLYFNNKRISDN